MECCSYTHDTSLPSYLSMQQLYLRVPAMVCIIGVGLLLSVRTGFIQIRKFPYAIKTTIGRMFRKRDASGGAMTPFQACS